MIDWIASQWNEPWKCLVSHAGVFDVRSQAWVMDAGSFIDAQFGSTRTSATGSGSTPSLCQRVE